jgi:RNA polymerase sigma factor (sigma-70 family)
MRLNDPQSDALFWNLWESHRKVFFRKCLKIMYGDIDEAEDALSSAMLKAREKMIRNCGGIQNFKGWALRLTENVCIDLLRRHRRLVRYCDVPESFTENHADDDFLLMQSGESHHSREAVLQEIFRMVISLPLRLREPFLLRFFLAAPYRCIAGRLCITEENARKRIQEARSVLRLQYGAKINGLLCSSLREREMETESPVMMRIQQDAHSVLGVGEPEVDVHWATAWIVNTPPGTGIDREVLVFLPLKAGWLEKRLASFLEYITKHPGGWKKNLELAQIFYAVGIWDKAEKEFRHVLKKYPLSFTAWTLLGGMLMESGRTEEAAVLFREAGSLAYRDSSREYLSGMSALCRGRCVEAFASFEKASELEPANISFRHAMGICLFRSERYSEALGHFEDILAGRPGDIVSLAYCCETSFVFDRLKDAGKYIDLILRNNPYDLFALKRNEKLENRMGVVRGQGRERLQRLMKRLERLKRMIGGAENEKFTGKR